eukprot:10858828-Lingulodinium_polyedra.AAC.1
MASGRPRSPRRRCGSPSVGPAPSRRPFRRLPRRTWNGGVQGGGWRGPRLGRRQQHGLRTRASARA